VREGYLALAKENMKRYAVIDGNGPIDDVFQRTREVIGQRLPELAS